MLLIDLYYIKNNTTEPPKYYSGTTFYELAEWTNDKESCFFFNHEPRKHEIVNILKNTPIDISMKDISINKITAEIKSENIIELL